MSGEKFWVVVMGIFVLGVFGVVLFNGFLSITGFVVVGDSGSEFDVGVYENTFYNGSGIVLFGENLSGSYISRVFDAEADASWNNISWISGFDYYQQELPDNKVVETAVGGADMTGNILLLHMNEASGTIEDTSGENNDGTYNGVLYSQSGKLNTALGFDGTNDYVEIADDNSLDITNEITIEAWVKPEVIHNSNRRIIEKYYLSSWYVGLVSSNKVNVYINGEQRAITNSALSVDEWSQIIVIYDKDAGGSDEIKIYINGEIKGTGDYSTAIGIDNKDIRIGAYESSGYNFDGTIDEVAIWNRSLSESEVLEVYKKGALKLNLTARTCDDSECLGESFEDIIDTSPQDLFLSDNQYFQYKFLFETDDSSYTPELESVSIDYDLLDSFSPQISFSSSTIETGDYNQDSIFVGVDVADDSLIYSFINFDNSLNAFYKLNDTGATIKDYSGNNYDGTISGASSTSGKFGNALNFDGTDTVDCAGAGNFERTDNFSVSVWVKSEPDEAGIIQRYDGTKGWALFTTASGTLVLDIRHDATNYIRRRSVNTVSDTTWKHMVFTYDGSSTLAGTHVYVNGELDDSASGGLDTLTDSISTGLSCKLGILHTYGNYRWIGDIDEVLIFNKVLSVGEISALYSTSSYFHNFTGLADGSYDFYAYAQDTGGYENQTEIRTVSLVSNVAPSISIVNPKNQLYTSNESLALDFVASDGDGNLDSCWYNVNGVENVSLVGCANGTFDVGGSGNYLLSVYANDSEGLESVDSVNFSVDVEGVSVALSEPIGEKSSRTGIVLSYSVDGEGLSCWYNVATSIGGSVIGNTSLVNCSDSSFDVSADGDYVLNLFVNNSYGSVGLDSSNFSVDISGDGSPGSGVVSPGSGGGGGGTFIFPGYSAELEVEVVDVIVLSGEEKSLRVDVKNVGKTSANKCRLVGDVDFVDAQTVSNIGVGEIVEFVFVLSVLDGVEDLNLSVECLDNVSVVVPLNVVVLNSKLDVSIDAIKFNSAGKLVVDYSVGVGEDLDSVLFFKILDSKGGVVTEISERVELVAGEFFRGSVVFELGDIGKGMLKISVSDEDVKFVEEDFVYGGRRVTGFVLSRLVGDFSYIGILLLVFLVLAGLLVRRIVRLRRKGSLRGKAH